MHFETLFFFPRSIFPIHPSFRIVVLAEPPVIGSSTQQWLGPEFLTLFLFHNVRSLSKSEEIEVIKQLVSTFSTSGTYWLLLTEQDYLLHIKRIAFSV